MVRELPQPVLQMVAPTAVSAGETVTFLGKGFADPELGNSRVVFQGVYQAASGTTQQVNLEVTPRYVNQGMLEWTFGPNIPFSKDDEIGVFRGTVKVTNVGLDLTTKPAAQPLSLQVDVKPSIIIKQMRPLSAACAPGITATTEDTRFLFEVKAVGLRDGSQLGPMRFAYTFLKEHFQFEGFLADQLGLDPESLFPQTGPVTVLDEVFDGATSRLGTGVPSDLYVHKGAVGAGTVAAINTGLDNLFKLTHLKTAPLANEAADYQDAVVQISAVDSSGAQATRTVPLRIWTPIEVAYDGASKIVRSFDPVPVSGCISGGYIGRDVTYAEMTSETRTRSYKYIGKLTAGVDIRVARLSAEFGIEVNAEVSSSQATTLSYTSKVLPNEYGAFYRQTLQVEREAKLRSHGPCGNANDLGAVVVTDWIWSPDLGKGRTCPPLPKSNLPAGEIFE